MAASPQEIVAEMDLQQPRIRDVFLEIVRRIVDVATIAKIEALIVARRIAEIPALLRIGPQALSPLVESIRKALNTGGDLAAQQMTSKGVGAVVQFDMRNTIVENWLRDHGAEIVKEITSDQVSAIRLAVKLGIEQGRNPRSIALDIVGRMDKVSGRRVGGIVGLTEKQVDSVAKARQELESLNSAYLERKLRDARFDGVVKRAIKDGKPLSPLDVERITARLSDRTLQLRGETIARTEALAAFNAGRELAMQQAIDSGTVSAQNVSASWQTAQDKRVRDSHRAMQGQKVQFGQVFTLPTGAKMKFPGDTSMNAGPADVINCRCVVQYKVDWLAQGLANGG